MSVGGIIGNTVYKLLQPLVRFAEITRTATHPAEKANRAHIATQTSPLQFGTKILPY